MHCSREAVEGPGKTWSKRHLRDRDDNTLASEVQCFGSRSGRTNRHLIFRRGETKQIVEWIPGFSFESAIDFTVR
jgi:hypothetical protein